MTQKTWLSGSTLLFIAAAGITLLFLLVPLSAIFGLGLTYSLGILLVADTAQVIAALHEETAIAPALLHAPLLAVGVAILAGAWGLGLSFLWDRWRRDGQYLLILLSALPFVMPRFGLGALFLLACLQLSQWGGDVLGLGLVALAQASVAAPLVASILCLGWRRIDPDWRLTALEAGADESVIFHRMSWPVLKPYLALGACLALMLSLGDFYLGNALGGDAALLSPTLFSGVARNASPLYYALVAVMLFADLCFVAFLTRSFSFRNPLAKEDMP